MPDIRWLVAMAVVLAAAPGCKRATEPEKPRAARVAPEPAPASFDKAKSRLAELTGAAPTPLQGSDANGDPLATEGASYAVAEKRAEEILAQVHTGWREAGFYVFRHERRYGFGQEPDGLGILPTSDKFEVIRLMGTNGINYDLETEDVIAWLRSLERDEPFELTGVGFDFLEGRFTTPVDDPKDLADMMYAFCPDVVDQGVGDVAELARMLEEEGALYFWWD